MFQDRKTQGQKRLYLSALYRAIFLKNLIWGFREMLNTFIVAYTGSSPSLHWMTQRLLRHILESMKFASFLTCSVSSRPDADVGFLYIAVDSPASSGLSGVYGLLSWDLWKELRKAISRVLCSSPQMWHFQKERHLPWKTFLFWQKQKNENQSRVDDRKFAHVIY